MQRDFHMLDSCLCLSVYCQRIMLNFTENIKMVLSGRQSKFSAIDGRNSYGYEGIRFQKTCCFFFIFVKRWRSLCGVTRRVAGEGSNITASPDSFPCK